MVTDYFQKIVAYNQLSKQLDNHLALPKQNVELVTEKFKAEVLKIDPEQHLVGEVPISIEKINGYLPTIGEIITSEPNQLVTTKVVKVYLLRIAYKYLSANQKSRSVCDATSVNILVEFITDECRNLELREVEFIFKNGIAGRFGTIYNDISLDTIIGENGWIETYYKNIRPKRQEVKHTFDEKPTGITKEEFYEKYPEYQIIAKNAEFIAKAKDYKLTLPIVAAFYNFNSIETYEKDIDEFNDEYDSNPSCHDVSRNDYLLWKFRMVILKYEDNIPADYEMYKISSKGKNITQDDVKKFYKLSGMTDEELFEHKRRLVEIYNNPTSEYFVELVNKNDIADFLRICFAKYIKQVVNNNNNLKPFS